MSKTETIEEKTYRLLQIANKNDEGVAIDSDFEGEMFNSLLDNTIFKLHCKMIELAIAEEREDNGWINVKDRLPEWASRDDTPCKIDGKKVGALLTSEKVLVVIAPHNTVRIDHLTAIESSNGERQHKWFDMYRDRVRYWSPLPAAPKAEVSE